MLSIISVLFMMMMVMDGWMGVVIDDEQVGLCASILL